MRRVLLARFGEVHLKGNNRPYFLRTLVNNVRKAVEDIGGHVWMAESRIYVANATDMDECAERVRKVFGIYSVSPAVEMEKDLEAIYAEAIRMMKGVTGTFKVMCKRSDKKFPLNSQELASKAGERILEAYPHLKVDVHKPQTEMWIEIRDHAHGQLFPKVVPPPFLVFLPYLVRPVQQIYQVQTRARADTGRGHGIAIDCICPFVD